MFCAPNISLNDSFMPLFSISFQFPIKLTSSPSPRPSQPTLLESVSRRVRTYVPSSILIPAACPTPPHVSRPVSFGTISSTTSSNSNRKRRGSDASNFNQGLLGDVFQMSIWFVQVRVLSWLVDLEIIFPSYMLRTHHDIITIYLHVPIIHVLWDETEWNINKHMSLHFKSAQSFVLLFT